MADDQQPAAVTNPSPPYPKPGFTAVNDLVRTLLEKFEAGEVSVAGVIMLATQMGWAMGHNEGEHVCVGCTHRLLNVPERIAPHPTCWLLSLSTLETSLVALRQPLQNTMNLGAIQGLDLARAHIAALKRLITSLKERT